MPQTFIDSILVNVKHADKDISTELIKCIDSYAKNYSLVRCLLIYNKYMSSYILVKNTGGEIPESCDLWEIKLHLDPYTIDDLNNNKGKVLVLCDSAISPEVDILLMYICAIKLVKDLKMCAKYQLVYSSDHKLSLRLDLVKLRNFKAILYLETVIRKSGVRIVGMKLYYQKGYAIFRFESYQQ